MSKIIHVVRFRGKTVVMSWMQKMSYQFFHFDMFNIRFIYFHLIILSENTLKITNLKKRKKSLSEAKIQTHQHSTTQTCFPIWAYKFEPVNWKIVYFFHFFHTHFSPSFSSFCIFFLWKCKIERNQTAAMST